MNFLQLAFNKLEVLLLNFFQLVLSVLYIIVFLLDCFIFLDLSFMELIYLLVELEDGLNFRLDQLFKNIPFFFHFGISIL